MNSISVDKIDSFLIDVSEAILLKNLHDFIFFQLNQKGILTKANSIVFYSYLKECKKYFIAHFEAFNDTYYIEPQILKAYYLLEKSHKSQTDLFILDNYFAIYKNEELIFLKPTKQKVSNNEIRNFIEKSLQLQIDECIEIEPTQIEVLKKKFENNFSSLKHLNSLKNNHYKELKYFIGVCFLSFLLISTAYLYKTFYQNKSTIEQEKKIYYPKKELVSLKLLPLLENINYFTLTLISMQLNNESINLTLKHKNKNKLIEFLTHNQGQIKTLNYNSQENIYELEASFKLI